MSMAKEFPEFVLTVAEENWIRGYQQAMVDIEVGESVLLIRKLKKANQMNNLKKYIK